MGTSHTIEVVHAGETSRVRVILRRLFSFHVFLAGLLIVGTLVAAVSLYPPPARAFAEGDTWWHIATGERILSTHTWPTSDPYSFTVAGHDWMAYEWLGDIVMALAYRLGGLTGIVVWMGVSCALILLLLFVLAYLRSGNIKSAFVATSLILPAAAAVFTPRPQLLSYVALLVLLILLELFRQGRLKSLWFVPVLFLAWVNTHGAFLIGLGVLGMSWIAGQTSFRWGGLEAERWSRSQSLHLAIVLLLSVCVLPLTPYGTRVAAYPFELSLLQPVNVGNIMEWQQMPFGPVFGRVFLIMILLFLFIQVVRQVRMRPEELALLLAAIYLACMHCRFVMLFAIVFAPVLARAMNQWIPGYEAAKDRPWLNATLLTLMLVGTVVFFPSREEFQNTVRNQLPQDALAFMQRRGISGPLFNEYWWGGYLILNSPQQHKVFIDGRADIYEYAGVLTDYLHVVKLESDTSFILKKYGIQVFLLERKSPLATFLSALPEWERVYADGVSVVFVRKGSLDRAQEDWQRSPAREPVPVLRANEP